MGRTPGEGKGYSLQYSGLENSMDCVVRGVTKNRLSDFHKGLNRTKADLLKYRKEFCQKIAIGLELQLSVQSDKNYQSAIFCTFQASTILIVPDSSNLL